MTQNLISDSFSVQNDSIFVKSGSAYLPFIGKRFFLFAIGICFSLILNAQVSISVNTTAGSLSSYLTATELQTVTNLTLTGTIDARDFKTMRDDMPLLSLLDLSGATIAAYIGTDGTYSLGTFNFPENEVPYSAFYNSNSVGKESLKTVLLPESITSIGQFAFRVCIELTSLNIPAGVISIGNYAFGSCRHLTSFFLPEGIISIGNYAFEDCSGLTSITIPSTVTSIGEGAFMLFDGMIEVDANNLNYSCIDGVLFNKTQTILIQCPTSKKGKYIIPESVTSIGANAFYVCNRLTSVTIPTLVNSIGKEAFARCTGITSLTIPASVSFVGSQAFWGCSGLASFNTHNANPLAFGSSLEVFGEINMTTCALNVPSGTATLYRNASQWQDFKNIREFDCPNSPPTAGDKTACEQSPVQTLTATATPPPGATVVWYDAPTGGNIVASPTLKEVGTKTYYAQSEMDLCSSLTRTAVILTINSLPKLEITDPVAVCEPLTVDLTAASIMDGSEASLTYEYFTDASANTILTNPEAVAIRGTYFIKATSLAGCSSALPVKVTFNSATKPLFAVINPTMCQYEAAPILPITSDNGITGTWTPATVSTTTGGTTTYTFIPDAGQCASPTTMNIEIVSPPKLVITNPNAVCEPSTIDLTAASITASSDHGLTYEYFTDASAITILTNPKAIAVSGTYYINATNTTTGCFRILPVEVTINPNTTPIFDQIGPVYLNSDSPVLQSVSNNDIVGTWSPAIISTATAGTTTYIFTPDAGQCAITVIKNYKIIAPPVAKAGTDQSENEGTTVSLDGSASFDPEGNPLTCKWTAPNGITLSSTTDTKPTFIVPEVKQDSLLNFSLTVNNGLINSEPSTVKISVKNVLKTGSEILGMDGLKVYPNPTSGKVRIVLDQNPESGTYLIVTDLNGKIILKQFVQNKEEWIDLTGNPSGVYLITTNLKNVKIQKILLR